MEIDVKWYRVSLNDRYLLPGLCGVNMSCRRSCRFSCRYIATVNSNINSGGGCRRFSIFSSAWFARCSVALGVGGAHFLTTVPLHPGEEDLSTMYLQTNQAGTTNKAEFEHKH